MNPLFTIGDFLVALTGNNRTIHSAEPTPEELNADGLEPFIAPSASSIESLKQQISFEAWLYLMGADSLGVKYNHLRGAREAQQHLVRSVALLDFKDNTIPLNSPAVRARIRWLQRRVLNLGGDTTPKPYYQLMAEGQMKRAGRQAAHTALWDTLSPEQQQHRLQEHWEDLSPEALEQCEQQAKNQQASEETLTVAPRKVWDLEIEHPAFAQWFVKELLCRDMLEVDAYLSVMWRIGNAGEPAPPGDTRRIIFSEQVRYVLAILAAEISDTTGKAQRILRRAEEWFTCQSRSSPSASDLAQGLSTPPRTMDPASLNLRLRQVALLHIYQGTVIPAAADAVARAYGHNSGKRLYELYNRFAHGSNNRTGVEGRAVRPEVV